MALIKIQINVPMCNICSSMLEHNRIDHEYYCRHCKTIYMIVGQGATDRELICEVKEKCNT